MRLILYAVIIYFIYRVLKAFFKPKEVKSPTAEGGVIDEMVQDPVCNTYIPRREAVRKVVQGHEHFFCSPECASKFELEQK